MRAIGRTLQQKMSRSIDFVFGLVEALGIIFSDLSPEQAIGFAATICLVGC